jgi:hypothetical protein
MEFSNLKIEIFVENSVSIQVKKGAFDSILALLHFNSLKNKGEFNGNYEQRLEFLDITDGVYHTSFPILNGVKYYDKEKLIKSFDHEIYAKHGSIVQKNKKPIGVVNTSQGKYKNEFFSIERIGVDSIVYYVRGNKEKISELLKSLRYIGKKSSLGWGRVSRIEIEETKEDYSLKKDGKLMRNIPTANSIGADSKKVALARLTHPYWSKSNLHECYMP